MTFYDTSVAALSPTRADVLTAADPGPFTVLRHIVCTTRAQHDAAYAALQPGDWVDVQGVNMTGEVVYTKQLAAPAKFTFDAASTFTGTAAGSRLPAIWLNQCTYLQFFFAQTQITNIGGVGILAYGAQHLVLDGFVVHDTGGTGVFLTSISRDMHHFFVRGEIYHCGLDLAQDPHAEKGTGQHAINIGDGNVNHVFTGTIAVYGHDMSVGTVSEFGDPSFPPYDLDVYLKGLNFTQDATSQVSANVVNLWGSGAMHDLRFHVIEGQTMHGRAVDCQGMSGGATMTNVVVAYGRANQCCLNPSLGSTEPAISPTNPWDPRNGVIYQDVQTNTGNGGGGGGGGGGLLPGTFGRESIGPSWAPIQQDNFSGALFQAPADVGGVTKLTAYLKGGPSVQVVRGVIFTATSAGPVGGSDTPVAASVQVTVAANQAPGWVDLTFASPPNLTPGAYYVLQLWGGATDQSAQFAYDATATDYWAGAIPYISTGLPPSPYPTAGTGTATEGISIYATYGPVVPTDTTPPNFLSAQIATQTVTLRFDEPLDPSSVPTASEFTVKVNGTTVTIANVQINGYNCLLMLAAPVGPTDTVTVAYGGATPFLQDVAANHVASWAATTATNLTARVAGGAGRVGGALRTVNPSGRIAGLGGGGI